jgi:hAT family C-terminal dimerisation region/Domain of unknown function (DUF4413)
MLLDVETRWNSAYTMLERALFLRKAINAFVSDDPELEDLHLSNGEWDQCSTLLKILYPFKQESTRIQRTRSHTIDLVYWTYQRLFDNLDAVETELTRTRRAKKATKSSDGWKQQLLTAVSEMTIHLKKYYADAVQGVYYMAVLLDPFTKATLFESESWRDEGKDYAKEYIDKTREFYIQYYETLELTGSGSEPAVHIPSKRKFGDDDDDDDYRQKLLDSVDARVLNEFDRYMASPRAIPVAGKSAILGWWKQNAHDLAHLCCMFRDVYGVPASSAGVEREFSKSGRVAAPGRARLNPATIRETMIYKSFLARNEEGQADSMDLEDEIDEEDEDGQVARFTRSAMRGWTLE